MYKSIFFLLISFTIFDCYSQSIMSSAISVVGGAHSSDGLQFVSSAGQSALITHERSSLGFGCRQGFIQPILQRFKKSDVRKVLKYQVYPLPASDFLHVQFDGNKTEKYQYKLLNSSGILCKKGELDPPNFCDIELSGLSSGMYVLVIYDQLNYESVTISIIAG